MILCCVEVLVTLTQQLNQNFEMKPLVIYFLLSFCVNQINAQWIPTSGPSGGEVQYVTATSDQIVYAATRASGIYKSTNMGSDWVQANEGLTGLNVNTIIFDSLGNLYASVMGHGVFKSVDQGTTWQPMTQGLSNLNIASLAINSQDDLFAGATNDFSSFGGVYKSTDQGETWQLLQLNEGLLIEDITLAISPNDVIWAGLDGELHQSTDGGTNWQSVSINGIMPFVLSIGFNNDNDVFVGLNFGDGLFSSTDNGITWTNILYEEVNSIVTVDNNDLYVATRSNGIMKSTDTGNNWETINNGLNSTYINCLCTHLENTIFAGTYGIYKSTDAGANWTPSYQGINAASVSDMITTPDGSIFAISDEIYRSDDYGQTWINVSAIIPEVNFTAIKTDHAGNIYVTAHDSYWGRLYKSTDYGTSWQELLNETTFYTPNDFAMDANSNLYIVTQGDGVLFSSDQGLSWENRTNSIDCFELENIAIDSSGIIIVAASCYNKKLFRSIDSGTSWEEVNLSQAGNATALKSNVDGHFFSGNGFNNVYKSTDGGISWNDISLPEEAFHVFSIETVGSNQVYVATMQGIYYSENGGLTWSTYNQGIAVNDVRSLAANNTGTLFSGTHGSSVWRRTYDTDVAYNLQDYASSDALIIYPNPAFDEIHINVDSSVKHITIDFLNTQGQIVSSSELSSGNNTLSVSNLKKGQYYVRVSNNIKTLTGKLIKL